MAREQEGQEARNKEKREMFDELMKLHAKAAEKSLSSILKTEIQITDPKIQVKTVRNIEYSILEPAIMVQDYLISETDDDVAGSIVYILRQRDMQVFLNQLMGIDELPEPDFEFDETALSAVEEVMNRMVHDSVAVMADYLEDDLDSSSCKLFLSEGPDTLNAVIGEEPGSSTFVIRYRISIKDVLDSEFIECISAAAIASINQEITYKLEGDEESDDDEEDLDDEELDEELDDDELDDDELDEEDLDGDLDEDELYDEDDEGYLDDDIEDDTEYLDDDVDYVSRYENLDYPQKSEKAAKIEKQPVKQTVPAKKKQPEAPKPEVRKPEARKQAARKAAAQKPAAQKSVQKQATKPAPASKKKEVLWQNPTIHENLGLIIDVPLKVSVEIGRTKRRLKDVLNFGNGMVVELDKQADAPVDIIVNGQLIARGEVVVIDDNFGVRISEIVNTRSIIGNGE